MLVFVNHDDLRSLKLMDILLERGYYVSDQISDIKYADLIYLGSKGIDRMNRLFYQNETILLDESFFKKIKKNAQLMTLIHNQYLEDLASQYGFIYTYFLDDEEFVEKNCLSDYTSSLSNLS